MVRLLLTARSNPVERLDHLQLHVYTVYSDGTAKNLMSLTGTLPVIYNGNYAFFANLV